jgi:hypothetical protein
MDSERENFLTNQRQRWYRRINWGVHKQQYRRILDEVVAAKAAVQYWDRLYVDVDTAADDLWIMMRLGNHPVDLRGNKFTVEVGGSLSVTRQLDGRVVLALLPCHLEGEAAEPIVLRVYDDPSQVTEAVLRRAIDDFFRVVRVTSAMLSSNRRDRVRVGLLRFHSKFPGGEKVRWVATNWPAFVLGSALASWSIYLGYVGLTASKPSGTDPNALIRRANPTLLRIVDVGWVRWSGDDERFLTLALANISNLDALDPKACLLEAPACQRVANSHGLLAAPNGSHLAIGRDETMQLPVLSESQVRRYLQGRVGAEVHVLGWGLKPELPVDLEHSCAHVVLDAPPCMADLHSVGIPVRVEWDTTLDEKRSLNSSVYVYVEVGRGRTGGAN